MYLVTASQMQRMDKKTITSFGIPGLVLMENAGRGAIDFLLKQYGNIETKKIAILAGRGNNGGDGSVIARYLLEKGIDVKLFLFSLTSKVTGDAKTNLELFQKQCLEYGKELLVEIPDQDTFIKLKSSMIHHDIFVDALLGTGLNSEVRGVYKEAIEMMNNSPSQVFSVDIPSGLDSNRGKPLGVAVRADATATFAFAKAGHFLYPGNTYTGNLKIIDIGIPGFVTAQENPLLSLIEKKDIAAKFSPRNFNSHKGSFGHLLVVAGSTGKTGAAILCSNAAMRCGTGLVTLGIAKSLSKRIEPMVIEPMSHPLPEKQKGFLSDNCLEDIMDLLQTRQALALGPGIGTQKGTVKLVQKLVEKSPIPMIIDADAINCIAKDTKVLIKKQAPAVLTPHPGEMARLCNIKTSKVQADRINIASDFAKTHDTIIVLKGAQSIIALPDGRTYICTTGNPGMASGGMGDVLTGMISGFCAQGFSLEDAALCAVYIHGLCADILAEEMGAFGFVASDIIDILPRAIHKNLL